MQAMSDELLIIQICHRYFQCIWSETINEQELSHNKAGTEAVIAGTMFD